MLNILNQFANGYVFTPVCVSFYNEGIFKYLENNKIVSVSSLCEKFQANEGHFRVAIKMLESMGWVNVDRKTDILTVNEEIIQHNDLINIQSILFKL